MKLSSLQLPLILFAGLMFTGCYTQYNATSQEDQHQAVYIGDGWFEIDGANFYVDYSTRHWFSYYGIDLATDRNFLRMTHFRYHHPTSPYFFSSFRGSQFYSYPGYSNHYFYRIGMNPWSDFYAHHPPSYSNPYMWAFYYNKWVDRRLREEALPNHRQSSVAHATSGNQSANRSSDLRSGGDLASSRNHGSQVSSRLLADRDDLYEVTTGYRISSPMAERVAVNERESKIRDRRDSDFRQRLERSRSTRSPLSSWDSWEQRNKNGDRIHSRTRSTTRSSATVRSGSTRSSNGSAVRGSSSNRGSSATRSSGSNRSSGDSSSSRGSN